jgi:ABC-type metal ion transport system substrate-binding protein
MTQSIDLKGLGINQRIALDALHKGEKLALGCGDWESERALKSLQKRGLIRLVYGQAQLIIKH